MAVCMSKACLLNGPGGRHTNGSLRPCACQLRGVSLLALAQAYCRPADHLPGTLVQQVFDPQKD
jgi:hypothetical protein